MTRVPRSSLLALAGLVAVALVSVSALGVAGLPGWWAAGGQDPAPLVDGGRPTLDLLPALIDGTPMRWGAHPFGQDSTGRDFVTLTMLGCRQSLVISLTATAISTALGVLVGAVAGLAGRRVDAVLMRLTDVVLTVPPVIVAAVAGHRAQGGAAPLAALLGLALWPTTARLVRARMRDLRRAPYVLAARASGARPAQVVIEEVLPNLRGLVAASAGLTLPTVVLLEAGLSYLGLGVQAPDSSLGLLVSEYQDTVVVRPWLAWWPGGLLVLIALCAAGLSRDVGDRAARPH